MSIGTARFLNAPPRTELPQTVEGLLAEVERLRPLAELGRMAATIAHEVRNPLAGISANAELVREALDDEADVESVDIILAEVDRLGNLIQDLLNWSRERAPDCHICDLKHLARSVIELSASEAERAGVELACEGAGIAYGDEQLSRQALLNILRNAIQASAVGETVTLSVRPAQIAVIDRGPGVPEDLREQLFHPFVTGRTRGLGLGAAVAKRCMQRQEGDCLLADTGASGSTFLFTWRAA